MPPAPRLSRSRAVTAVLASLAVGTLLASCSSDDGEGVPPATVEGAPPTATSGTTDSPHGSFSTPATIDPDTNPADEVDSAAITAVIDEYITTTNAQDADGFRAILCAPLQSEYADLRNEGPVPDPMLLDEVADIAVDGDAATANLTYKMGLAPGSLSQTSPFKFSREDGEWKVCGSPE